MPNIHFSEEQRFNQLFTWFVITPVLVIISIQVFQLVDGSKSIDTETWVGLGLALIITIAVGLLLTNMRLITTIDNDKIHVRFIPFVNKSIKWTSIEKAFIISYKPVLEYGGWGIRRRFGKIAYTVSGKKGLQLILTNGKKILIGTQKPDDLSQLLQRRIQSD